MRYVFICVCALVGGSPLATSAQVVEEGVTPNGNPGETERSDDSLGDDGGLSPRVRKRTQEKWDRSTYDVRYAPVSQESSPRRLAPGTGPSVGLAVSVASIMGGAVMVGVGVSQRFCFTSLGEPDCAPRSSGPLIGAGSVLMVGGLIGTIVSATALADQSGGRWSHGNSRSQGSARRLQWNRARSRVEF